MSDQDATGQKRLAKNLLSRWLVEAVVIVSGFVVPRLLDTHLGREQLGVWDFGWTIVSYCRLLGFGLASGLNRFVALNKAEDNNGELRRAVSSTVALQILIAIATVAVATSVALSIEVVLPKLDPELYGAAKWCIIYLGGTVAIRMLAWPARGVLTGQHLWAMNSYITMFGDIVALIAMVFVLRLFPSLVNLAFSYMLVAGLAEILRYAAARRVHRGKMFRIHEVSWRSLKKLFFFGMKSNLLGLSSLVLAQTISVAIAIFGGTAMLAVFARALALQRHSQVFVVRFADMLTPTAASMQGLGKKQQLRRLFLDSMRISSAMTLPLFLLLAFVGDQLIRVWMGEDYVVAGVLPIICLGSVFPISQVAAIKILTGLNQHGRVAVRSFVSSTLLLAVSVTVATVIGWTPVVGAILLGVCFTFGYGREVAVGSCKVFDVGLGEYLNKVLKIPLLINFGLFIVLMVGDQIGMRDSFLAAALWGGVSGLLTFVGYWVWLIPEEVKKRFPNPLRSRRDEAKDY